jgi:hypothetical protein
MRALREQWARSARQNRSAARFARDPSERARAIAQRLLEEEARVLASIDATTTEGERARLTAHAADLRRMATEQQQEAQVSGMKDKGKEIRERMKKRLSEVAQRMALVKASEDEQYPPEFQVKRQEQRSLLTREWQAIESQAYGELQQWADESSHAAEALYASDPLGDAASESRRTSRNLEIAALAGPLIGQPQTMVRNHLLPEARRFLALGNTERAEVFLQAAKRAGVVDSRLEQALSDALDDTVPHRKQALAQLRDVQDERDSFDLDRYSARIAHGVGSSSEQVRNSTALKLAQWRQREGLVATPTGASGQASGEGDGGASSE